MFVCAVHPATSAVLAVVGDGRSGDPLHERGDKRDVYEARLRRRILFRARSAGRRSEAAKIFDRWSFDDLIE